MIRTAYQVLRDRERFTQIATVMMRFGMSSLAERLGLKTLLRKIPRIHSDPRFATLPEPVRLRMALENLGPTFIKLGQILATRADFLPAAWITELEKLQSQVPALPWEDIRPFAEEELGADIQTVFARFDTDAFAAASIAQVHRAQLHNGDEVIVKIRRPHLRKTIEADMRLLSFALGLALEEWPELARYNPADMLRHLSSALLDELDLAHEGRNTITVAHNLDHLEGIAIPHIFEELTSEGVLVQEFLSGIHPTDPAALDAKGFDRHLLAQRGAEAFLHMVLVDGVFHADPHAGNMLALPDNTVAFLDFGMVGYISAPRREQLLAFVEAIVRGDSHRFTSVMLDWSEDSVPSLNQMEADAAHFIATHSQGVIHISRALTDCMALARRHAIILPAELVLLFKAMITAENLLRQLDPSFDLIKAATPLIRSQIKERYSLSALRRKTAKLGFDLSHFIAEVPLLTRLLTQKLKQGEIKARISITEVEHIARAIERTGTRIAMALVVAAFALGLAPHLLAHGPTVYGMPLFALAGFCLALAGLCWLAFSSMRT